MLLCLTQLRGQHQFIGKIAIHLPNFYLATPPLKRLIADFYKLHLLLFITTLLLAHPTPFLINHIFSLKVNSSILVYILRFFFKMQNLRLMKAVKHLSFFTKKVNGFQPKTISAKKTHLRCLRWSKVIPTLTTMNPAPPNINTSTKSITLMQSIPILYQSPF